MLRKNFTNALYFYWNLGKRFHLMCLPLIISIIFHTRETSTQGNVSNVLDFYVSGDVIFRISTSCKSAFSHRSISLYEVCTKQFRLYEFNKRLSNWNKDEPLIFVESIFQICQSELRLLIYIFMFQSHSQYQ